MKEAGRSGEELYQKDVTIDGARYKLVAFGPSKAFRLAAQLSKLVGEPMAAMATAVGDEDKVSKVLPMAVKSLMTNLDEDRVLGLIKELTSCVEVKDQSGCHPVEFEDHFQARLGHMMKVVTAVISFQFSDLFSEIGEAIADVMPKKAKAKA
jgi:hypothetical protein